MHSYRGFGIGPAHRRSSSLGTALLVGAVAAGGLSTRAAAQVSVEQPKKAALHLGSTPWSPFTNEPGKPRLAIDLVHEALERVGISSETAIVAEGTLTKALLEGQFDGSPALWRAAEREDKLIYSKPYLENRLVLVGRKGSDVSATSLGAVAGKRIAVVDGYAYGEELEKAKGSSYVASSSVEASLEKVLNGEADFVLMDELVVQHLLTDYPEETRTRLAIGPVPLMVRSLHFAVRRNLPGAQSIVDRFDAELGRMITDRSYHRLLQVGWIDADVDGDGRTEAVPASDLAGQAPPARRYELVTVTASAPKPEAKKRFYLGGQVYEDWANVPDRYKAIDANRTPWGTQVAPIFSFKW